MAATGDPFRTVRRLSQYRPFEGGGASARAAQQDLVLASLAEAGWESASISELADTVRTLFTVALDETEVGLALNELIRGGQVVRRDGGGWRIASQERERLTRIAEESRNVADSAHSDWREFLSDRWPGLTDDQLGSLGEDLRCFLQQVVSRHGAEATMLLYPDDDAAQQLYASFEEAGFDYLPRTEPALEAIRDPALSHFIRHPTQAQRAYLAQTLNAGYFLTVLSIDHEGARLVREIATGQWIYLDTNFLFRLVGIQGPRWVRPSRTIVGRTKDAGYGVAVTPWTIAEFKRSLERGRDYLHRYPVPPSDYAELLAEATSDEDFVTAYWRQVKDSPISIDDFHAHWLEVETHLAELGVQVRDQGCAAVDRQDTVITDEVGLLAGSMHGRYRHPSLLEHDVKHRLLVQRLRGAGNRSFANAGYWFLTFDSVLPRYDYRARRESGSRLPFCVSAGSWFQIIEAFRPKTEEGAEGQALADLLASPYVRYRSTLSKEKAQKVVARVQLHEGGNPQLAACIMMNSALIEEIDESTAEAETETIDNAIVSAAHQAQEDARRAQETAEVQLEQAREVERRARDEVERTEARAAREKADAEARFAERLRNEEARSDARVREERESHSREVRELSQRIATVEADRVRQKRRLRAVVATIVLALLAFAGFLAIGLDTLWAIVLSVATLLGAVAAIDHLWIRRGEE